MAFRHQIRSFLTLSRGAALGVAVTVLSAQVTLVAPPVAMAGGLDPADTALADQGWVIAKTGHAYGALVKRLSGAVKAEKMGLVNFASASDGARGQGFDIPGNRVVGVYRNDFARRMLAASIPAGIEAPIRFYVTENADGTASPAYRPPGAVSSPYFEAAEPDLRTLAGELDTVFDAIFTRAIAAE